MVYLIPALAIVTQLLSSGANSAPAIEQVIPVELYRQISGEEKGVSEMHNNKLFLS